MDRKQERAGRTVADRLPADTLTRLAGLRAELAAQEKAGADDEAWERAARAFEEKTQAGP
jgi:hypothetical protein